MTSHREVDLQASSNCAVFLACSQLNQKLRESSTDAQTDTSQANAEPQPVQPSVSIALHIQCISIFDLNTQGNLSRIIRSIKSAQNAVN